MKIIKYNQIDRIIGDHLITYKGRVYQAKENLQTFPKYITLVDNGISEEDFEDIRQDIITALNGR